MFIMSLEQVIFETNNNFKNQIKDHGNLAITRNVLKKVASIYNVVMLNVIDEILVTVPVFYNFKSDLILDILIP